MPLFVLSENIATLTLCDANMTSASDNNSLVAVKSNNCEVNLFNCNLNGSKYAVNIRNYGDPGSTYKAGTTTHANDATCNVTIRNCTINASISAVNWKRVGGSLIVEKCTFNIYCKW